MNTTSGLTASAQHMANQRGEQLMQRILLYPGELYRIVPLRQQVKVVQGTAYLSHGGKDYFVQPGEAIKIGGGRDIALVSPVRGESLVMEVML